MHVVYDKIQIDCWMVVQLAW